MSFKTIGGVQIMEGYGLSEASPVTHRNPIEGLQKAGSIGIPIPNMDARIVDRATGTMDLPFGEVGELKTSDCRQASDPMADCRFSSGNRSGEVARVECRFHP